MGVPKFYRWISERYPKINQIISDQALLPEFDHLYLDMNGIIHGCTHPSDMDLTATSLSTREMCMGIMQYLDRIITQIVKPRVSVYMAIDGVAPRAKLNQQRSRRFRSAKDMAEAHEQNSNNTNSDDDDHNINNKNNQNKKKDVFDSNCITPGTEFLAMVSDTISYFIRQKLKEDAAWHGLTIIFSGHDIPGEGEHKIMQHIRQMRASTNYSPNTRHCIYGQDADLIMLGLVTHEPHFTILREVIDFNAFSNNNNRNALKEVKKFTKESDFQLLHLSVLREYLQIEFCSPMAGAPVQTQLQDQQQQAQQQQQSQPQFDLERCIDDFVFMTFLVGNDFLPHLPTLDIGDGAFDLLFNVYKQQRNEWAASSSGSGSGSECGPYLVHQGTIPDPARLEAFVKAIGSVETDILTEREKNNAEYIEKKRRWDKRDGKQDLGPSDAEIKATELQKQSSYLEMIQDIMSQASTQDDNNYDTGEDDDGDDGENCNNNSNHNGRFVSGWQPVSQPGEKDFKGRYYFEKLQLTPLDKQEHWELRKAYVEGLLWCLAYYYKGCISWGWFYPYHYGPMLSDLMDLPKMFAEISFDMGTPLTPFEQLMGCLPPASSILVPPLYRPLMTSPTSPILQFYPENFKVDMNDKKNPWEGVNLLPFIDVALLKKTIATHCPANKLSAAERKRNTFGKVYAYRYDVSCNDTIPSPNKAIGLPDIVSSHSSVCVLEDASTTNYHQEASLCFQPQLVPGTRVPYPGFPLLNVLPIASVELTPIGLNCFGMPSKHSTTVLTLHPMPELPALEVLANNVLGKSLFINWPMMHEGKVVAISNNQKEIRLAEDKKKTTNNNNTKNKKQQQQQQQPQARFITKIHTEMAVDKWYATSEAMHQMYLMGNGIPGSGGVQIGPVHVRLKLLPLQGMKLNPINGSTKKLFGREEADVPLQLALWQAPAPDPRFEQRGPMTVQDRFPAGCNVVLTKGKYRGCTGTVVAAADEKNVGVKVQTIPAEIPFGLAIARSVQESYISSTDAARILKINPGLLGKVAGRLPFEQDRYDLGLNLKSSDGMSVVGYTRKRVDQSRGQGGGRNTSNGRGGPSNNNNNNNNNKPDVWSAGDALLVIGSSRNDDEKEEERIQWEYTPKAIRLVESYRQRFPQLFSAIGKTPNEKKYDAKKVFGPNGEAWLPEIREWLNQIETAKLPRTPVTTQSMSYEAVAAIQKAADVRTLALKKRGYPKESLIKIPGSALYREGSTGATDVLLASDWNKGEAPGLGDRIVNLTAAGIPFGARGTVVGIHEAATTGSVEVVMDEEFIGGSSLQGACSNFRGKLCLWAHLLKVAPENSEGLVDKLVPKGKGAAVDNIISSIEKEVKPEKTQQDGWAQAGNNQHVEALMGATETPQKILPRPSSDSGTSVKSPSVKARPESRTPTRSSSRSGSTKRAGSANRARQGAWREARGPPDKGHGFQDRKKHYREGGLVRWKKAIGAPPKGKASTTANTTTNALKSILGVGQPADKQKASQQAAAPGDGHAATEDGLKALLGVKANNPGPATIIAERTEGPSHSANLKAMLGVAVPPSSEQHHSYQVPLQPPVPLPPPPEPTTAAEKLMRMMAGGGPAMPPPQPQMYSHHAHVVPQPPRSSFNFTYVEEGQQQQQQQQPPPTITQMPPYPGMVYPSMAFGPPPPPGTMFMSSSYAGPPPPPPPHAFGFPPPPPPPPQFMTNFPPPPVPQGLGAEEFPPLGQEKAPKKAAESKTAKASSQGAVPPGSISSSARGVDLMVPAAFVRK